MQHILLKRYRWQSRLKVCITGCPILAGKVLSEEEFLDHAIKNTEIFRQFAGFCDSVSGHFSAVVEKESEIWLHTGHTWSFPLYYSTAGNTVLISDIPEELVPSALGIQVNENAGVYFRAFGVTPGSLTLDAQIRVVRPGESVCLYLHTLQTSHILHDIDFGEPVISDALGLATRLRQSFAPYAEYLADKQVLLPLTGGYDSRLIACLLKEADHKRVISATWGRPGNADAESAAEVAAKLGFQHIFVPYDEQITGEFPLKEEFTEYAAYAGHLTSMPFLQDYFAIRHLLEKGYIDKNTVVTPGHLGGFLRGSNLIASLETDSDEQIAHAILERFSTAIPLTAAEKAMVINLIRHWIFSNVRSGKSNYDRWDYEERQCKLIGNSSQAYGFFHLQHLHPLADKELMRYMLSLPISQRLQAKLYKETVEKHFFSKYGINTVRQPIARKISATTFKNKLIRRLPRFIKKMYYPLKDPIFYREITGKLGRNFPGMTFIHPIKPHFYNAYLVQWYLQWISLRK